MKTNLRSGHPRALPVPYLGRLLALILALLSVLRLDAGSVPVAVFDEVPFNAGMISISSWGSMSCEGLR